MPREREPTDRQLQYFGGKPFVPLPRAPRRPVPRRPRYRTLLAVLRHDLDQYDRFVEKRPMMQMAPEQAASFFRELYRGRTGGLHLIVLDIDSDDLDDLDGLYDPTPDLQIDERTFAFPDDLEAAVAYLAEHNRAGYSVFHTPNLVPAPGHESEDDRHITVLHTPVDAYIFSSEIPATWDYPPAVIVHTGPQTYHGYWVLDPPIAPGLARNLGGRLASWLAPRVEDVRDARLLERPLRVPGFVDPRYSRPWLVQLDSLYALPPFLTWDAAAIAHDIKPRRGRLPRPSPLTPVSALTELAKRRHWVALRYLTDPETGTRVRDAETDEPVLIPLNPRRDEGAYLTNPQSWGPLRAAMQRQRQARADGLGYILTPADQLLVLVLDHCRDAHSKALTLQARVIVQYAQTFTTVTPDGTGLRLLLRRATSDDPINERYGRFALASTDLVPISEHTVSGAPNRFARADEAHIAELRVLLSAFGAQVAVAATPQPLTPPPAQGTPEAALAASRANEQAILQITANAQLTAAEQRAVTAVAYWIFGHRAAGQVDADGAVRTPLTQLAQAAGCSVDALAGALDRLVPAGIFTKEVRPGADSTPDKRQAVYLTTSAETIETFLAPFATFAPERPGTWGGRRTPVSCPDHPNASITRAWRCSECGRLMDAAGEAIDPQDADPPLARDPRTSGGTDLWSLLIEDLRDEEA